jgi:hypothetical protein
MSEKKTTQVAAESGHWYTHDGELVTAVARADGKGWRKPTLRDARKAGNYWLPGCTTILRQAAAPALVRWQQERAIEAALQLDQQPEEERKAYMRRVLTKAGETAAEAAAVGTEVHKAIEQFYSDEAYDKFYRGHVLGVADVIEQACPTAADVHPWLAEVGVVHDSGFATRVDLHSEAWVLDFKTKDGTPEEWGGTSGRVATFSNHWMQLAACRKALEQRHGWEPDQQRCAIVYVSRDHAGLAEFVEVPEPKLQQGWQMFQALMAYWKAANAYDPMGQQP